MEVTIEARVGLDAEVIEESVLGTGAGRLVPDRDERVGGFARLGAPFLEKSSQVRAHRGAGRQSAPEGADDRPRQHGHRGRVESRGGHDHAIRGRGALDQVPQDAGMHQAPGGDEQPGLVGRAGRQSAAGLEPADGGSQRRHACECPLDGPVTEGGWHRDGGSAGPQRGNQVPDRDGPAGHGTGREPHGCGIREVQKGRTRSNRTRRPGPSSRRHARRPAPRCPGSSVRDELEAPVPRPRGKGVGPSKGRRCARDHGSASAARAAPPDTGRSPIPGPHRHRTRHWARGPRVSRPAARRGCGG